VTPPDFGGVKKRFKKFWEGAEERERTAHSAREEEGDSRGSLSKSGSPITVGLIWEGVLFPGSQEGPKKNLGGEGPAGRFQGKCVGGKKPATIL